jgi:Ca2+-binding RTX toxin-like protein
MAKIKFTDIPPTGGVFEDELILKVDQDRERAVYTDGATGAKVIIYGANLKESADEENHFSAGTVDKLVFKRGDGEVMITVEDGGYKAKDFNAGFDEGGAFGIYSRLLAGNDRIEGGPFNEPLSGETGDDRIIGNKGEDTIYGGAGDDVMTGGKQADQFFFGDDGVEHDRITDLDIEGGDSDSLQFEHEIDKIGKTNGGKDTMITFEGGSTLELDGVKKADFIDFWETPA